MRSRLQFVDEDWLCDAEIVRVVALVGFGVSSGAGILSGSWPVFLGGLGLTGAAEWGIAYHRINYYQNLIGNYKIEKRRFADPRHRYSYNQPSTLIKAFLPEALE